MNSTSKLEKQLMLKLFKELKVDYNASSISKGLGKTRVGTFKALKNLERKGLIKGKILGKATFYKPSLNEEYTSKTIELLLMEEAKEHIRWLDEFKEIYSHAEIVIIFGSILRNEKKAGDIDLLIILNQKSNPALNKTIDEKNGILIKKIHPIKQTQHDLISNIKKDDKVILSALKEGIVLHGYGDLVRLIKNVSDK